MKGPIWLLRQIADTFAWQAHHMNGNCNGDCPWALEGKALRATEACARCNAPRGEHGDSHAFESRT